ncbi:hypothetical protein BGZ76_004788 [Entomortierella beljakovae]|nr:hypothetical protein BGZ76_004788 [Entomortierella beljakovae]
MLTDYEYDTLWNAVPGTLPLGVLLPLNGNPGELEYMIIRKGLTIGINMSIVLRDSQNPALVGHTGGAAAIAAAGSLIRSKVGGVVGDLRSDLTEYEALMTSSVKISQCSFASASTELSSTTIYPYFYRTIATVINIMDAMLVTAVNMGWNRVTIIHDTDLIGFNGHSYLEKRTSELGIYVLSYIPISVTGQATDPTLSDIKATIDSTDSRIQLLIATSDLQRNALYQFQKDGYMNPIYAWITVNDISNQIAQLDHPEAYDGVIMIDNSWDLAGYAPYDEFHAEWMSLDPVDYPGAADPEIQYNEAMAYSCVMMLAITYGDYVREAEINGTLDNALREQIIAGDKTSETSVIDHFQDKHYIGPSGEITLNEDGDREAGIYSSLFMRNGTSATFAVVTGGNYTQVGPTCFGKNCSAPQPKDAPPWTRTCVAQTFIFPVGVTVLASALVIKKFRIFRIFNSVAISHRGYQSRLLARYVVLFFILSLIPVVVEVVITDPEPYRFNVKSNQWIRCRGQNTQAWWYSVATIVPIILILFGVFLAFRTRNIVFLWNEARQIALVLYNIFFFGLILGISQFFPTDLYAVTFHLTLACAYVMSLLSLLILSLPKFWRLWDQHKAIKSGVPWDSSMCKRFGFGGFSKASTTTSDGGYTSGGFLGSPVVGRMPDDLRVAFGDDDTAVGSPPVQRRPALVNGTPYQSNQAAKVRKRRKSGAESLVSLSKAGKSKENPITVWMNQNILKRTGRRRESSAGNEQNVVRHGHDIQKSYAGPPDIGILEAQHSPANQREDGEREEEEDSDDDDEEADEITYEREPSLDPKLRSADGRSSSYLMVSMIPSKLSHEYIIRVTTESAGSLLIRFHNRAQLEGWMNLFSEEDRTALVSKELPSQVHGFNDPVLGPAIQAKGGSTPKPPAPSTSIRARLGGGKKGKQNAEGSEGNIMPTSPVSTPRTRNINENGIGINIPQESADTMALAQKLTLALSQEEVPVRTPRHKQKKTEKNGQMLELDDLNIASDLTQHSLPMPVASSSSQSNSARYNIPTIHPCEPDSLDNTTYPMSAMADISAQNNLPDTRGFSISPGFSQDLPVQAIGRNDGNNGNGGNGNYDDDDEDDLYDPEFGIGGSGRRRYQRTPAYARRLGPEIPPPDVITAAAAASVSTGRSASDTLSAAVTDPSGNFLSSSQRSKSSRSKSFALPRRATNIRQTSSSFFGR